MDNDSPRQFFASSSDSVEPESFPASPSKCFTDLPLEVRLMVYEYYLSIPSNPDARRDLDFDLEDDNLWVAHLDDNENQHPGKGKGKRRIVRQGNKEGNTSAFFKGTDKSGAYRATTTTRHSLLLISKLIHREWAPLVSSFDCRKIVTYLTIHRFCSVNNGTC